MKKILLINLCMIPLIASASSLDMNTLRCRNLWLTNTTTLADVRAYCLIRMQNTSNGRYDVKFRNDTTGDDVTCHFGSDAQSAILNSCH